MSRRCSHCGNNGHNSRTCMVGTGAGAGAAGGFKLFGVRVAADSPPSACSVASMRKSFSMGNLSTYDSPDAEASPPPASPPEQPDSGGAADAGGAGYASDDLVHTNSSTRERKKGVPWTEEEHRSFLLGLQKLGKGDWRGISRNFVKTRTPTQVASHAQKYFLRRSNLNKRRRRSSLFDITPDTGLSLLEESVLEEPESEQVDACPELTLGQTIPHANEKGIEAALLLRRAYSVEDFTAPTLPRPCVPMEVPKVSQEACENEDADVCAMDSASENAFIPPVINPVINYLQNPNCDTAGGLVQPGFPFPFLAVWPAPWQFGADKQAPWSSETKIVKPTPIFPTPPPKVDDTVKLSELSLNPTRPVMEPSPLSYQLMEEGSRNSAFHSMPNTSTGELDTKGNLSNAISVT